VLVCVPLETAVALLTIAFGEVEWTFSLGPSALKLVAAVDPKRSLAREQSAHILTARHRGDRAESSEARLAPRRGWRSRLSSTEDCQTRDEALGAIEDSRGRVIGSCEPIHPLLNLNSAGAETDFGDGEEPEHGFSEVQ
jgi:hypothetical protein